jgi:hypothetical protein
MILLALLVVALVLALLALGLTSSPSRFELLTIAVIVTIVVLLVPRL